MDSEEVESHLQGSPVPLNEALIEFFLPLFSKNKDEYSLEIVFLSEGGEQQNEARALIRSVAFGKQKARENASLKLASRLGLVTDRRSKPGLLIVLYGRKADLHRILLWKFPADESLQVMISAGKISIQVIKDAFSRQSSYFKAAMFEGAEADTALWKGQVDDKQAKPRVQPSAEFWIHDFLAARSVFTPVHGTRVASKALKKVIERAKDVQTKGDLVSAARVLRTQGGRNVSFGEIADNYLPPESREDFLKATGGSQLAEETFRLVPEILERELRLKSIMLDDKFIVSGPLPEFDEVVGVRSTGTADQVEVSLKGKITSESIKTR